MNERIAELLSEGYSDLVISSITGLRVLTIKEMREKPEIKALIDLKAARSSEQILTGRYERLEDMALKGIEQAIAMCEVPELLKVIDTVQKKKAVEAMGKAPASTTVTNNIKIVNIGLPARLVPAEDTTMILNAQGEIVSVGGRSFAALPTEQLPNIFARIEATRQAERLINAAEDVAAPGMTREAVIQQESERARGHVKAEDF